MSRLEGHRQEAGLTLVEVIVSMALLVIVSGAISAAFAISFKVAAPGQAQDRLAGAHDQQRFEQNFGQDISRAACVKVGATGIAYGSCTHGFASNAVVNATCAGSGLVLCVGWPDVAQASCHIVAYTNSKAVSIVGGSLHATGTVKRQEFQVPFPGSKPDANASNVTTDTVNMAVAIPAASGSQSVLNKPEPTYSWVKTLYMTVSAQGSVRGPISDAPTQPLVLHPLATDPASQAASITQSGPPC